MSFYKQYISFVKNLFQKSQNCNMDLDNQFNDLLFDLNKLKELNKIDFLETHYANFIHISGLLEDDKKITINSINKILEENNGANYFYFLILGKNKIDLRIIWSLPLKKIERMAIVVHLNVLYNIAKDKLNLLLDSTKYMPAIDYRLKAHINSAKTSIENKIKDKKELGDIMEIFDNFKDSIKEENIENLEVKNGMEFITDKNSDLKKLTERTMKKFLDASNKSGNNKEQNLQKYRDVTKSLMNAFVKDKKDLNTIKQMLQKNMNLSGEQSNKLFNGIFDSTLQ